MRVLILNFILSTAVDGKIIRRPSNRDTMIYNLARGFCRLGHSVTIAAADEFMPLEPETNDFEVVYFPSRYPRIFKPSLLPYPKGLGRYLKTHASDFDMVLSVEVFSIPTLIASRYCPDKLMIWQEMAFMQRAMHRLPARMWYGVVVPAALKNIPVVCQSPAAKKFISRYMKRVSEATISHGVDGDMFYCSDLAPKDAFVVVSMLVRRKRIDRIIENFARFVADSERKYKLHIVGEGPLMDDLKQLSVRLGVEQSIEFHGFMSHSEFAALERQSLALLIDTCQDNNMVSIPEAIVNGTPVLTNSVPTNSVYISQYKLGMVKDGWGADELARMARRYPEFHANCCACAESFSNTGVATQLINEFNNR